MYAILIWTELVDQRPEQKEEIKEGETKKRIVSKYARKLY
jgi:hypothetical protein